MYYRYNRYQAIFRRKPKFSIYSTKN